MQAQQLALALREEVASLQAAGCRVVQVGGGVVVGGQFAGEIPYVELLNALGGLKAG